MKEKEAIVIRKEAVCRHAQGSPGGEVGEDMGEDLLTRLL